MIVNLFGMTAVTSAAFDVLAYIGGCVWCYWQLCVNVATTQLHGIRFCS